jgi:ribose 5-phosphate isomerase B
MRKIAFACDHAAFEVRKSIFDLLKSRGYEVLDFGTEGSDSVDYPDHVHPFAKAIVDKEVEQGILVCGSGNGVAMTANKYQDIRAALCWNKTVAELSRQHNNANVIALPARFVSENELLEMIEVFLDTDFEGGRHDRRVGKIACC